MSIAVVDTKPVPVTVTTGLDELTSSVEGETEAIVGAGFSTTRFTGVPDELVVVPLDTTTGNCIPVVNCAAGTVAVNSVLLTYVVTSATPPTSITLPLINPDPMTVIVCALAPAERLVGVIDEIAGVGVTLPPPPEPEPPPLQPLQSTNTARVKKLRGKRPLDFIWRSIYRRLWLTHPPFAIFSRPLELCLNSSATVAYQQHFDRCLSRR
jgi:hypothetical protein